MLTELAIQTSRVPVKRLVAVIPGRVMTTVGRDIACIFIVM